MNRRDRKYENGRNVALILAMIIGIGYAIVHGKVHTQRIFSFEGGVFAVKVLLAIGPGALGGFAIFASVLLLTVSLAPEAWLQNSATGQTWMKISGLKSTSTLGLRLLTFGMTVATIGIFALCVYGLFETLTLLRSK